MLLNFILQAPVRANCFPGGPRPEQVPASEPRETPSASELFEVSWGVLRLGILSSLLSEPCYNRSSVLFCGSEERLLESSLLVWLGVWSFANWVL